MEQRELSDTERWSVDRYTQRIQYAYTALLIVVGWLFAMDTKTLSLRGSSEGLVNWLFFALVAFVAYGAWAGSAYQLRKQCPREFQTRGYWVSVLFVGSALGVLVLLAAVDMRD